MDWNNSHPSGRPAPPSYFERQPEMAQYHSPPNYFAQQPPAQPRAYRESRGSQVALMHSEKSEPWWKPRYWRKRTWAIVAAIVVVLLIIIIVVPIKVIEANRYPNYTKLNYSLADECKTVPGLSIRVCLLTRIRRHEFELFRKVQLLRRLRSRAGLCSLCSPGTCY
jgi:hypothetical protein